MSIILKGIDMPKEGEHIVALIKSNGKCSYWKQDTEYGICEPMQTVEAIQIPTPHGDLIDAKDLMIALQKCVVENDKIYRVVVDSDMETLIHDADVILEKER